MTIRDGLEAGHQKRRRVLMPMIIFAAAIGIGLWFPGRGGSSGDIERRLRGLLSSQCDPAQPTPAIRWTLPVVRTTFEAAALHWCERGVDPKTVTITRTDHQDGARSITLRSPDGTTIQLLLTLESDGTPLVSSIRHDPAGT